MKKCIHCSSSPLLLLLFLTCLFRSSVHSISAQQRHELPDIKEVTSGESAVNMEELMGLEACESARDEECLKRRIAAEAHLDYIYTQQHKP
uniref:Phytosulfokine n=1 Tax=Rhizophora mucronata TaxID=61149 RepID=A0A2P2L3C0_RHIMU